MYESQLVDNPDPFVRYGYYKFLSHCPSVNYFVQLYYQKKRDEALVEIKIINKKP